jgi:hypothetical protein
MGFEVVCRFAKRKGLFFSGLALVEIISFFGLWLARPPWDIILCEIFLCEKLTSVKGI